MPLPNANDFCGFNMYESCNCGDQCKSAAAPLTKYIDIGLVPATSDMRGVFGERFRHSLIVLIGAGAIAAAVFVPPYLNEQFKRDDRVNQEIVSR